MKVLIPILIPQLKYSIFMMSHLQ